MDTIFEIKLIEMVKENPCLYNRSGPAYKNRLRKEVAWLEVAAAIGSNAKLCQQRWRSLRDQYAREIVKSQKSRNSASLGKWKYATKMAFLKPQFAKQASSVKSELPYCEDPLYRTNHLDESDSVSKDERSSHCNIDENDYHSPGWNCNGDNSETVEFPDGRVKSIDSALPTENMTDENETMAIEDVEELQPEIISNQNEPDHISTLVETLTNLVANQMNKEANRSRNTDFLKVLDSYLLQLPENVQDEVKIEMLNLVYNKQKEPLLPQFD